MRFNPMLAVAGVMAILSPVPRAEAADCLGFFNQTEQGFKLERGRLRPTGPTIAAGTQLEFNGIGRLGDKFYLTRSRSDIIYDAQNVELTGGCDLPTLSALPAGNAP